MKTVPSGSTIRLGWTRASSSGNAGDHAGDITVTLMVCAVAFLGASPPPATRPWTEGNVVSKRSTDIPFNRLLSASLVHEPAVSDANRKIAVGSATSPAVMGAWLHSLNPVGTWRI